MFAPIAPGTTGLLLLCLLGLLVLVNGLTYLAFALDKRRAATGGWRIPERTLLSLAFVGGWIGAKTAQRRFRHKTRKEPFRSLLNAIGVVQVLVVLLLVTPLGPVVLRGVTALAQSGVQRLAPNEAERAERPEMPRRFGPGS